MTTAAELATIADLERHPGRCELIDGEIIDMAPAGFEHGRAVAKISRIIGAFLDKSGLPGAVLAGDPGFILDDQNVLAPDVAFLTPERVAEAPPQGFMPFLPALAVEVVSPSDTHTKVVSKARRWIRHGVALVWIADPRNQTVEVYRKDRDVVVLDETAHVDGADVLPGFSCLVGEFFA